MRILANCELDKMESEEKRGELEDDDWEIVDNEKYQMGGQSHVPCKGCNITGHVQLGAGKYTYEKDWNMGKGHSSNCPDRVNEKSGR